MSIHVNESQGFRLIQVSMLELTRNSQHHLILNSKITSAEIKSILTVGGAN